MSAADYISQAAIEQTESALGVILESWSDLW
jgi:hypothetical protein